MNACEPPAFHNDTSELRSVPVWLELVGRGALPDASWEGVYGVEATIAPADGHVHAKLDRRRVLIYQCLPSKVKFSEEIAIR
jgi:hypothetical protein